MRPGAGGRGCGGGTSLLLWRGKGVSFLGFHGRKVRTIAIQAQRDDGEDELKGAKREVEVNHGGFAWECTVVPAGMWMLECGVWNA